MKALLLILILTVSISFFSCAALQKANEDPKPVTIGWDMPVLIK